MSFGSGDGNVFTTGIKFIYPNIKPQTTLLQFGRSQYRIALVSIKKLPRDYLFIKDNFKTEIMKKRGLKEEIEYRLGMYFGIKSGALYVRDDKFGNTEEILNQLQRDITRDVNFLSRKTLGYVSEEQDFKSICVFYKTKLMK